MFGPIACNDGFQFGATERSRFGGFSGLWRGGTSMCSRPGIRTIGRSWPQMPFASRIVPRGQSGSTFTRGTGWWHSPFLNQSRGQHWPFGSWICPGGQGSQPGDTVVGRQHRPLCTY
jgi:hypothetical protein